MKKLLFGAIIILALAAAAAGVPFGTTTRSEMTWYDAAGYGACGEQINARTEQFVAVSHEWWTAANPNNDPLCKACVKVTYKGKSITVPIKDKCPGCAKGKIDLSRPLFLKFQAEEGEVIKGATYTFVKC